MADSDIAPYDVQFTFGGKGYRFLLQNPYIVDGTAITTIIGDFEGSFDGGEHALTLNSYTMDDGMQLPILTGGTYDENGYFTKST